MKKASLFIILLVIVLVIPATSWAKPKYLQSIDLLTGFGWGKLKEQGNYHLAPTLVSFNFDLKPFTEKFNFRPRQLLQFQIEPFLAYISEPHSNAEFGTSFFLKVGFLPETSKFQPYIKAGTGMDYMTLHTREQGTQFNFISTGALGMHYFFRKDLAFTLEGRYRHLSNCSIDHPNSGINTAFVVSGITYQF